MIVLSIQSTVIITSIVFFLVIILLLVSVLLFAKKKLTPSGTVNIDINDGEKKIEVEPGSTVLSTLGNNGIFL
ncbi:MAG: NADH:ubiquinone reductase (Na(+)-transporting) subunit F, partial [Prolixibacteraceae bacterium]|nr:NADH:ubiquinone reductase (Na(+)-transporting) subunit F [Prolixibacteraceae bacterium]